MAKGKKKKSKSRGKSSKSTEPDPNIYFGKGNFTLPNGDSYEGEYCAHVTGVIWREGHGIYKTQDGQTYEGEWKDDKLVENSELIIKYRNGAEYYGRIMKDKYKGPGVYALENNMDVTCAFEGNKPTGIVTLVDCQGKLWVGEAKQNNATLFPENIFFLNLTDDRGKGYPAEDETIESFHEVEAILVEEELSDREWEKIIFASSGKTEHGVDFTDTKWWQQFDRFQKRKEEILRKLDDSESLASEENLWIQKFKKYEAKRQKQKEDKLRLKEEASKETMLLIEKFGSPEFKNSCPGVSVFYPRSDWETADDEKVVDADEKEERDEKLHNVECYHGGSDENTKDESILCSTEVESNESIISFCDIASLTNCISDKFENLIRFKRYMEAVEAVAYETHFTKEREEYLEDLKAKLLESEIAQKESIWSESKLPEITTEKQKKGKQKKGKDIDKRIGKQKGKKQKKNKDSSESGSSKKGKTGKKDSQKIVSAVDEKAALQSRITEYVCAFMEAKKLTSPQEEKKTNEIKSATHTHNIAVDTESTTGIPIDLLFGKF